MRDLHWIPEFPHGSVATVGEFDGVHRGHRVVLLEMLRVAVVEGCPTVVVTFDSNPVPRGSSPQPQLTDLAQKLELLEASGVDAVVVLSARDAADQQGRRGDVIEPIADEVLTKRLRARAVVVGDDFRFSPQRRLSLETLRHIGTSGGFRVVEIPVESRRTSTGEVISARSIRDALVSGDVEVAARMLGRPHEIRSRVASGERRGRTIGFPTANLPTVDAAQPGDGVYACWYVRPDGTRLRAAVNIGKRPTFHEHQLDSLIEAHILDFSGDLYEEQARLQFVARLRSEAKFESLDAFQQQLRDDVAEARRRLV